MTSRRSLWERLDDIDRRLGLHRSVKHDQRAARWWRAYFVTELVLLVIAAVLYVTGHNAAGTNTMVIALTCTYPVLDGWSAARRLRRDAERAGPNEPRE